MKRTIEKRTKKKTAVYPFLCENVSPQGRNQVQKTTYELWKKGFVSIFNLVQPYKRIQLNDRSGVFSVFMCVRVCTCIFGCMEKGCMEIDHGQDAQRGEGPGLQNSNRQSCFQALLLDDRKVYSLISWNQIKSWKNSNKNKNIQQERMSCGKLFHD